MPFELFPVQGGVYLRTSTGELIGRLDKPGSPFETLEEARCKADWLVKMLLCHQTMRQGSSVGSFVHPHLGRA